MGFGNTINVIVFIFKCWFLVFIMMWVALDVAAAADRSVMMTCLKYLVPISCALLMGVSLWQLLLPSAVVEMLRYVIFAMCMAALVLFIYKLFTSPPPSRARGWRACGR